MLNTGTRSGLAASNGDVYSYVFDGDFTPGNRPEFRRKAPYYGHALYSQDRRFGAHRSDLGSVCGGIPKGSRGDA
jgi:hypothetical protein